MIEENFHDEWAASINMDELDIYAAFTADTFPEFRYALSQLGDLQGKSLLDAGCGPGESSIYFAKQGAIVTAVDISSGMLKVAQRLADNFEVSEDMLRFVQMSVERLDFADESFDLIFGSNIVHHCDIKKASIEFSRVLKPGGVAVFVDPLGYNPVIQIYRRMAFKVRTPTEHPLNYQDLEILASKFQNFSHKEFQLMTQLIFLWFFLVERIHPSDNRYWRKYVLEADRYTPAFRTLYRMDQTLLKILPFLKPLCWNVVSVCKK